MEGFDWDEGNETKNWIKHKVTSKEAEEVFQNTPLIIAQDMKHSKGEVRYSALGQTNVGRKLTIFFTVRNGNIRVISIRNQSKKERRQYAEKTN